MIAFDSSVLRDVDGALTREWLETNGLGGFASSTIAGLNTRRYHALLVAALDPPVARTVLLSKLEETLVVAGDRFELGANRYPGVIHPRGFEFLREFRLDPFPTFVYRAGGVEVTKTVFLVHGENTAVVQYALPVGARIEVRPLIAFRDYHSLQHRTEWLSTEVREEAGVASVQPYGDLPRLFLAHNAMAVRTEGVWYYRFQYDRERERGLDFEEDLFNPLVFEAAGNFTLIASLHPRRADDALELRQCEIERRRGITVMPDEFSQQLAVAADAFLVSRGEGKSLIAGYPWFSDWGRDTMIALPGVALATGKTTEARGILLEFAKFVDQGMIPNRFPDKGETPEYNTADASLWFFEAVRAYVETTGDFALITDGLYETLTGMLEWHVGGTRFGIGMDADGLLRAGAPGVQLTWMDAKVGDWVVTPRRGKPVEIQALWYNALRIMQKFAKLVDDPNRQQQWAAAAERARVSFAAQFWNQAAGCLYDVIDGDTRDASIRPNQLFAIALPHSLLAGDRARQVVEVVTRELLTPYGLRTLAPGDPQYRGRYGGDQRSRDAAYHQGTVWPWLLGPFARAYLAVYGCNSSTLQQAREWLLPMQSHLTQAGLGQISEIFDGDPPHAPTGCTAQAWSVAEVLRAWLELTSSACDTSSKRA